MGRPWWYDNYWDSQKKDGKRSGGGGPRFPRGRGRAWLILLAVVALLTLLRMAF